MPASPRRSRRSTVRNSPRTGGRSSPPRSRSSATPRCAAGKLSELGLQKRLVAVKNTRAHHQARPALERRAAEDRGRSRDLHREGRRPRAALRAGDRAADGAALLSFLSMEFIHDHLHDWNESCRRLSCPRRSLTLAKRRWRAVAEDGTNLASTSSIRWTTATSFPRPRAAVYVIAQKPEPVLEVRAAARRPAAAARLGWLIGNLHFPLPDHRRLHARGRRSRGAPAVRARAPALRRERAGFQAALGLCRPFARAS